MTFRFFERSEIRDNLGRLHNNLTQQYNAGANDFRDHTDHTHNGVYLRQVSAVCPQLLPDIGDCIDPDDINSLIHQIQHIINHLVKNHRIGIV